MSSDQQDPPPYISERLPEYSRTAPETPSPTISPQVTQETTTPSQQRYSSLILPCTPPPIHPARRRSESSANNLASERLLREPEEPPNIPSDAAFIMIGVLVLVFCFPFSLFVSHHVFAAINKARMLRREEEAIEMAESGSQSRESSSEYLEARSLG